MSGVLAHGAIVKYNGSAVSGPLDLEITPSKPELVDATNHDSTVREYVAGLYEDGKAAFDILYSKDVAIHKTVRDLHGSATAAPWTVTFKDGTIAAFNARTTVSFRHGTVNKLQVMHVELAIVGAVGYTP